jgi:replicative DNA helicase
MFQDSAAEIRLLAALIEEPNLTLKLTPDLFTEERIDTFTAMKHAYMKYGEITSEGVEFFSGAPISAEIQMAFGARPAPIIDKLIKLATKRRLVLLSNRINHIINSNSIDREAIMRELILPPIIMSEDASLQPGITNFISDVTMKRNGQYRFIDTGLGFLNHMLGGEWPRQALTVVLGQGGAGKTACVANSMLNMARIGIPSLFISLEMPKAKLVSRFVANMASVDGLRIRKGDLSDEEVSHIDAALEELNKLPIYIIDRPSLNVEDILFYVKTYKEAHGIEAFFVDYLQIVNRHEYEDNGSEGLGIIAQKIRNVAVEEEVAAVLLSQQNRSFDGLASILGSGRVGHISDVVFEIKTEDSQNDDRRTCQLDFHKNRDGPLGSSYCSYLPKYLRFE